MLAQSFKTHTELNITAKQLAALQKVLVLFETDTIEHVRQNDIEYLELPDDEFNDVCVFTGHFNMGEWFDVAECGTVACIGGTAELITCDGDLFKNWTHHKGLHDLFCPLDCESFDSVTPSHAARALRNFLTTGTPSWKAVLDTA